ncbi:hypothetical protein MMC12_001884 [Toensbergia leucococca]|nr:hypothetical protein [Toensbergia leucococca]
MSLKQEIETWVQALAHYDNNEFEESLKTFDSISDTSKILFNCGMIHATLGEHHKAVECFQRAIRMDNYLAIAYFQQGVSNFLVGDFEEALVNFNDTLKYLRGNAYINYEQLGLKFKLFSCEVLFNRGLCYIYLQQKEVGLADMAYASIEKATPDHDVIDEAIKEEAEGYTVFSIPVGVVYRPNSAKVKNLKAKDYLGKARLVAASDQASRGVRPPESVSFAFSNHVKPNLQSRSRQHSEPPIHRNMFPPTPPPDNDQVRPAFTSSSASPPSKTPPMIRRTTSVRSPPNRPEPLNLTKPCLEKELPRPGTIRTASEPRGPARNYSNGRSHRDYPSGRGRLFMETTPLRPNNSAEADINEYPDELYDMYQSPRTNSDQSSRGYQRKRNPKPRQRSHSRQRPADIDETNEDANNSNTSSLSDFEILNNAGGDLSRPRRPRSSSRGASRSRRPIEIKSIRVKVHSGDDTRYLMIGMAVAFEDFVGRVKEKFGVKGRFKLKIRDEGDLITMGDRDDWDMALQTVSREARREGTEMGKMQIWIYDLP